jgi:hypothetical protein
MKVQITSQKIQEMSYKVYFYALCIEILFDSNGNRTSFAHQFTIYILRKYCNCKRTMNYEFLVLEDKNSQPS